MRSTLRNEKEDTVVSRTISSLYFGEIFGRTKVSPTLRFSIINYERVDRSFKVDKTENRLCTEERGEERGGGSETVDYLYSLCKGTKPPSRNSAEGFEIPARSGKIRADFHRRTTRSKKAAAKRLPRSPRPPRSPRTRLLVALFAEAHVKRVTLSCTSSSSADASETLL